MVLRKTVIVNCDWCGKEIEISSSELGLKRHFCNPECRGKYHSAHGKNIRERICLRCKNSYWNNNSNTDFCYYCGRLLEEAATKIRIKEDLSYREYYLERERRWYANKPLKKFICEYCKKPGKAKVSNARFHNRCAPKARAKTLTILTRNQREEIRRKDALIEQLQIEVNTAKEWWDYYEQRSALKEETIQRLTFVLERASERASKHKLRTNGKQNQLDPPS